MNFVQHEKKLLDRRSRAFDVLFLISVNSRKTIFFGETTRIKLVKKTQFPKKTTEQIIEKATKSRGEKPRKYFRESVPTHG